MHERSRANRSVGRGRLGRDCGRSGDALVIEDHCRSNTRPKLLRFARFDRALINATRRHYERADPPSAAVEDLRKNAEFADLMVHKIKTGLEYGDTPSVRANMNVNVAYQAFAGEKVTTANWAHRPLETSTRAQIPRIRLRRGSRANRYVLFL